MANAFQCDLCKKLYPGSRQKSIALVKTPDITFPESSRYDICTACYKSIKEHIDSLIITEGVENDEND